jgi:hypothetical protein
MSGEPEPEPEPENQGNTAEGQDGTSTALWGSERQCGAVSGSERQCGAMWGNVGHVFKTLCHSGYVGCRIR